LKEVLKYCENKPEIVVDRDSGIRLEKIRIEIQTRDVWRKECSRSFFSRFKERTKSFWNRSLSIALLILYRAGLRVLWHSVTTGGVKLTPPGIKRL